MNAQHAGERVLLWGGYGFGNVGDELTLAVAVHDFRRAEVGSLRVLTRDSELICREFPGVEPVVYEPRRVGGWRRVLARWAASWVRRGGPRGLYLPYYRPEDQAASGARAEAGWLEAVRNSTRLHLVGGGYLTDLFSVDYFLMPVWVARSAGVPISTGPLGLGPFGARPAAARVMEALRGVAMVVRDERSLAFCREAGLTARWVPDDGFRVTEVLPGEASEAMRREGVEGLRVGVCMFRQHGDRDWGRSRAWWLALLRALRLRGPRVHLEAFCYTRDRRADWAVARELCGESGWGEAAVREPPRDLRAAVAEVSRYDVVISARFHAVVVAHAVGVPHVAVAAGPYYAAKMAAAVRGGDRRCWLVDVMETRGEEVAASVVGAIGGRNSTKNDPAAPCG